MPGALLHPQPCVQMQKAHKRIHHRSSRSIDIPCAMVLTGYVVLSPVSVTLLVTVALRNVSQDLAPAQGCQDHTPLPSAATVHRLRTCRVHRIPRPTFGDDWPYAPLQSRRDDGN